MPRPQSILFIERDDEIIRDNPNRRRTRKVVTMLTVVPDALPATMTDRDIARCAFKRYEERGRERGHDIDDWLQAERDLQDALSSIVGCYPREMPGLHLRLEQVQRLCGIGRTMCQMVLDSLVDARFLSVKSDGLYALLIPDGTSVDVPLPLPTLGEPALNRV